MNQPNFNYKDIFRACRLGFSAKKMWMSFLGLLIGFAGYCIISYIAFLLAGWRIEEIWTDYRLLPFPQAFPWYSWIIWIVGALWWICVSLLVGVAVSKITYEQLRGDEFYEIKDALKFAMKTGKSAILAPFVLILFILSLVVMGLILALITRIPWFGVVFFAVMSIPAFAVCLFILYLVLVTLVALLIGPSIVGATGNDTFDTLFESFSVINDQPWRFITYQVLLHGVIIAGVVILAFFSAKAIFLGRAIVGVVLPMEKLDNILMNAAYYVKLIIPPFYPEAWQGMFRNFIDWIGMPNLLYPLEYMPPVEGFAGGLSSIILGAVYYFIVMFVSSLACSIYWAGNTVIFTVLVKKKDEKNLLEIKEEPLEEKPEEPEAAEKADEKKTKRGRKKEDEKEEPEPKEGT